jgi:D-hexose-6-phosphate mutarotase
VKIRFEQRTGVRVVHIENESAVASVSLFGGQLLTWQPKRESQPVLWMSPLARFDGKAAIRGGVPLCWPWFGKHPSSSAAPAHGYARLSTWEIDRIEALADGRTELVMSLPREAQSGEHRHPGLGHTVRLAIGDVLDIDSTTRNDSPEALRVTEGLHTYFQISDVANTQVSGLSGCDYVDLLADNQLRRQEGSIGFGEEVGRIFVHCDKASVIEDRGFKRRIDVSSRGSRSTAVWNPGLQTASKMADLGSESWRTMVCVETANALEDGLTLAVGETHTLSATYSISPIAST